MIRRALAWWPAAMFLSFAVLPFLPGKDVALYAQDFVPLFIYALLALGLNVVVGNLGLLHLGIAAFFGATMNVSYMLAGSNSTNPILFALTIGVILAWRVAGYYGLDRFLLPLVGVPWHRAKVVVAAPGKLVPPATS